MLVANKTNEYIHRGPSLICYIVIVQNESTNGASNEFMDMFPNLVKAIFS